MPRPMGHALRTDKPIQLMRFDCLYLGPGANGCQRTFNAKDDASTHPWLEPTKAAGAASTADVLERRFARFGVALSWSSK